MRAGKLRQRITLQEVTETRDAVGGIIQTWADVRKVWAQVEPLSGQERFAVDHAKADIDTRITVRGPSASDVTPKMRILFGAKIFDIESILDIESRDIRREIYCKEAA